MDASGGIVGGGSDGCPDYNPPAVVPPTFPHSPSPAYTPTVDLDPPCYQTPPANIQTYTQPQSSLFEGHQMPSPFEQGHNYQFNPTRIRPKKKAKGKARKGVPRRGENYTNAEDKALCSAYLNIEDALKEFKALVGKSFQFMHRWHILRHQKKWQDWVQGKPDEPLLVGEGGSACKDSIGNAGTPKGGIAKLHKRGSLLDSNGQLSQSAKKLREQQAVVPTNCVVKQEPEEPEEGECQARHVMCGACRSMQAHACAAARAAAFVACPDMDIYVRSARLPCPNKKFGCKACSVYCQAGNHECACQWAPCRCPDPGCAADTSN
ncbi:hypothetical protein BAE44_0018107 [Dichanthelium oligosanthes]|uniref:SIAH-type domain-containing protein n=1 Tax=Dichanthelium oligosanthes TaxID=888268 RepID=A0A1E5V7B4_9POAL|nr:hypothetical protein BAE44_0018107 [Dichanthelium oligosanthes]